VGETEAIATAHVHLAGKRVEGRKQPVFDEDVVAREGAQDTRLPGVRVADQRGRREGAPPLTLIGAMIGHVLESATQRGDLLPNHAPVGLELRLARSPQADTAPNAGQVRPLRVNRGNRYSSCANFTCILASAEPA